MYVYIVFLVTKCTKCIDHNIQNIKYKTSVISTYVLHEKFILYFAHECVTQWCTGFPVKTFPKKEWLSTRSRKTKALFFRKESVP